MTDNSNSSSESGGTFAVIVTLVAFPLAIYVLYWHVYAGNDFSLLPALVATFIAGVAGALAELASQVARRAKTTFSEDMARAREQRR